MLKLKSIILRSAADVFFRKKGTGKSKLKSYEGSVKVKLLNTDFFGNAIFIILFSSTISSGPKYSVILIISPKRYNKSFFNS